MYKDFAYPPGKESREQVDKIILAAYEEAKEIGKTIPKKEEEVLSDKPKGVKDKLNDGKEKSKSASKPAAKKSKTAEIE